MLQGFFLSVERANQAHLMYSSSALAEYVIPKAISKGKPNDDILKSARRYYRDAWVTAIDKLENLGLTKEEHTAFDTAHWIETAGIEKIDRVCTMLAKKLLGKTFITTEGVILRVDKVVDTKVYLRDVLRPHLDQTILSVYEVSRATSYSIFTHSSYLKGYVKRVLTSYMHRVNETKRDQRSEAVSEMRRRHYSKPYKEAIAKAVSELVKVCTGESTVFADERDALGAVADALNEAARDELISVSRIFEKLCHKHPVINENLTTCDDCGEIVFTEETSSTNRHSQVCQSCIASSYYWSDMEDDYLHDDDRVPVYRTYNQWRDGEPEDYVSDSRNYMSGYEYRDSEGAWFENDIIYDCFPDEDEDEDEDGLSGYHDSYREFVERWENKSYVPLGVELEVYAPNRRLAVTGVRKAVGKAVYLESDGSLDDYHGFEIITQPLGKTEWSEFAPKLLDTLLEDNVCGYNHPDDNSYGIHISINREYLSPLQEARMSLFLTAEENGDFVRVIAQRQRIYGGSDARQIGSFGKMMQNINQIGGINNGLRVKKIYGMGKYSPLNLKSDIAECRIFQSTLHKESFMKNLEFMWALVEWTSVKAATGSSWMHTDFVKWLATRPAADTDFPYLLAYLRRKEYRVKRGQGVIKNTWLELLPTATRHSKPVEELEEEEAEAA